MQTARVILVTGFLGSGKTSLLAWIAGQTRAQAAPPNAAPEQVSAPKLGLIVNEFGKASVDGPLLESGDFSLTELNNGSLFCQCLAGQFADSVVAMLAAGVDLLLIEASGLADPSGISTILDSVRERSERPFTYAGALCVVDAHNYPRLSKSLQTAMRQVLAASLVVINKTDLVSAEQLAEVVASVRKINPMAKIRQTTFGQIELADLMTMRRSRLGARLRTLNTVENRPASLLLELDQPLVRDAVLAFAEALAPQTLRIKGLVTLSDQQFARLDSVGEVTTLAPAARSDAWPQGRSTIVILAPRGNDLRPEVERLLALHFSTAAQIS